MNLKKLVCILSSIFIISGPSSLCNNAKATKHILSFNKNFYIENDKSNCGWISASINFLKYCIDSKTKGNVKTKKLHDKFVKICDKNAYDNNKTENIFRILWSIRRVMSEHLKTSSFSIEHYIKSEDIWSYICHTPDDTNYEPPKGNNIEERLMAVDFEPQAIFRKYLIENKMPLICGVDLGIIFNLKLPFPLLQSAIVLGCETDDSGKYITDIILHPLVPGSRILKFSIKDFLSFCRSVSGICPTSTYKTEISCKNKKYIINKY